MTHEQEYLVPGEVQLAIQSARPEFLNVLLHKLERGEITLPPEQVIGIVKALHDVLVLALEADRKVRNLSRVLVDADKKLERMEQNCRSVIDGFRPVRKLAQDNED